MNTENAQTSVTLTFTDAGSGVEVKTNMPGGFDKNSKAHQIANMVMNYLDSVAEAKEGGNMDAINSVQVEE